MSCMSACLYKDISFCFDAQGTMRALTHHQEMKWGALEGAAGGCVRFTYGAILVWFRSNIPNGSK